MKVNKINIEISTLENKHKTYLYNEMFSLAREHNCFYGSEFGNYFISIKNAPEKLLKGLKDLKIKFRKLS